MSFFIKMNLFSETQQEQLEKAQEEAAVTKKTRERLAKLLGVPEYEIVAPNLLRAASLFGLLKKNSGSILDIFSSQKSLTPLEYKHYVCIPLISEQLKLRALQKNLNEKAIGFTHWINNLILQRLQFLDEKDIALPTEDTTFQGFQIACLETMKSYENYLNEITAETSDASWILPKLAALRKVLLGFIDLKTTVQLAKQHILLGEKKGLTLRGGLNPYEELCLVINLEQDISPEEIKSALQINYYTRDPKVEPFSLQTFKQRCCTPALMFCPLEKILEWCLFNPFYNNNIGYHRGVKLFYILYDLKQKKRYWVSDPNLSALTKSIGEQLVCFLFKTYRQLFRFIFKTNEFRPTSRHPRHQEFLMLLRNWSLAKNLPLLAEIIKSLTRTFAEIYATNLDFFNSIDPEGYREIPLRMIQCAGLYDIPIHDEGWQKLPLEKKSRN